jgi:hypothetical protein
MERELMLKSIEGAQAYEIYRKWMKQSKRFDPPHETFKRSKFFMQFYKFAVFANKVKLPNIDLYIRLMIKSNIQPSLWTRDEAYKLYTRHIDYVQLPLESVDTMVTEMIKICDYYECQISEIFTHLKPNEVIQLLYQRRFTPWVLLNSIRFNEMIKTLFSEEQKRILKSAINTDIWAEKFKKYSSDVCEIKKIVKALGL